MLLSSALTLEIQRGIGIGILGVKPETYIDNTN